MKSTTYLIEAIRIMDERGRKANNHDSIMLWEKEWDSLRDKIFQALWILTDNNQLYPTASSPSNSTGPSGG